MNSTVNPTKPAALLDSHPTLQRLREPAAQNTYPPDAADWRMALQLPADWLMDRIAVVFLIGHSLRSDDWLTEATDVVFLGQ